MHRIDTPTAQKDKFGAGKNGFTRGNPQTGTPATDLDDDYFDMLQEELAGVVEASGVNLEKSKHNQLLTALKALLLSRAHPFADIKADGAAAIAEALSNLGLQFFLSAPSIAQDSFTRILSPDEGSFIFLKNNEEWGVLNSSGTAIPLSINHGGIGATTPQGGVKNLGLSDSEGRVGRLINVRVITASGTYTPSAGTKSVVVEVQGGGGAGGAAGLVSGGNIAMGGGGAAGAYARSRLVTGFSGVQITIGAGGKGKKPDYTGMNGGNTSFGTITAAGGTGGAAIGAAPPFIITAVGGAVASGGSIVSIKGASSLTGIALSASNASSGPGGSSPLGVGGGPRSATIAGDDASGFGSGGSGALNLPGATGDLLGGDGSDGVVIVWEYA
ncbi:hypothetical protein AI2642V1_1547 [Citrobacter freundii]|uniref:glycine-rich domain-containing protein n=1 Tax=Citrobacter freundii TaxID=546 RepID=UPI001DB75694|nr:hypothetical protein [Citrobacter freundii]CAE6217898.1 hypothetical protein AI2642V1_1547 [Citrobacter freundii]CAH3424817.1 hypothetical protein AI2642V1_1547 [Citrobacter freundii]